MNKSKKSRASKSIFQFWNLNDSHEIILCILVMQLIFVERVQIRINDLIGEIWEIQYS